jgi:hypothetical protein
VGRGLCAVGVSEVEYVIISNVFRRDVDVMSMSSIGAVSLKSSDVSEFGSGRYGET